MTSLIENLRFKLSQNRSLRDGRSDSLRNMLSIDCNVDGSMIVTGDKNYTNGHITSNYAAMAALKHVTDSVDKLSANEMEVAIDECAKKYKVECDLACLHKA